jgi:hypothetical protein
MAANGEDFPNGGEVDGPGVTETVGFVSRSLATCAKDRAVSTEASDGAGGGESGTAIARTAGGFGCNDPETEPLESVLSSGAKKTARAASSMRLTTRAACLASSAANRQASSFPSRSGSSTATSNIAKTEVAVRI